MKIVIECTSWLINVKQELEEFLVHGKLYVFNVINIQIIIFKIKVFLERFSSHV